MATTSPDNLYSPDGSNAYNIPAETGAMQTSVQAALVQRANFYRGTSGQRTALSTAGQAMNGTYWSDTNGTQELYRFNGTAWVSQNPVEDSGWVTPTLLNGWTSESGLTLRYRKYRGVLYISGRVSGGTAAPVFNLPVGFRPEVSFSFPAITQTGTVVRTNVNSSGQVDTSTGNIVNITPPPFIAPA